MKYYATTSSLKKIMLLYEKKEKGIKGKRSTKFNILTRTPPPEEKTCLRLSRKKQKNGKE